MRRTDWRVFAECLFIVGLLFGPWSNATLAESKSTTGGVLPVDSDGRQLNFDFERGTLDDWRADGQAFAGQPIEGDVVQARRGDMHSGHAGRFWIGGFERHGDRPLGTLTSRSFRVTHPFASFLVAGGPHAETSVELVRANDNKIFMRVSGDETENLKRVMVDLRTLADQEIFIRLVDRHGGHWGHLNFDDFLFHAEKPETPERDVPPGDDAYLHAGLSPQEAAEAMNLPDGFSATLFAGEPDVRQPIAMALDDRGRLWIAEAYSYPVHVPEAEARDRILIFEDVDGDGRFDKRTVFIERLNLVSGLEVGFGGVWVGAAPNLLFIPDHDGDDRPDGPPQTLLDGWGYQDTHETLNSFIWGPDGWLYGCHGVFTHSRVGKPGADDSERQPINAGIWRYHPVRHEFEVFAHGTSNPWGVDFDDHGQAFLTACVIPHLYHVIHHARYERQAGRHFNPHTYDDIKTIADHRHWDTAHFASPHAGNNRSDSAGGGHAHAGAMIYLGGAWPEEQRGRIFMNNIHGQRINTDRLTPRGSGFVGSHGPDFLLANDRWSQIINLRYGPDGQVYLIDWYDKQACHTGNVGAHDRTNGRIFKVAYGAQAPTPIDLAALADEDLVALQTHANDWYVRHARRILQERKPNQAVHKALEKLAFEHTDDSRRLRGLWALHVTGGLDSDRVERALADASPHVRGWAIQLLMENSDARPAERFLHRFAEMAEHDPSPVVRLYLASALQDLPLANRWAILGPLTQHAEDAEDHNLPLMLWYAAEPLAGENAEQALELALASRVKPLPAFMVRRIAADGSDDSIAMLVGGLQQADEAARLTLLEGLNEALKGQRKAAMPNAWPAVYRSLIRDHDQHVAAQATTLALTFGDPAAFEAMRELLVDRGADGALRRQALAGLLRVKAPRLAETLHLLMRDESLRGPVLRGLAAYDDPRTPNVILSTYDELSLAEKRDALATLSARAAYARALLKAVGDQRIASSDLSADLVRQLRGLKDEEINQQISELWGAVRETSEDAAKRIAAVKALLDDPSAAPADPALGRAMFAKTCAQCHTLFDAGGKVGPELTGSNRRDLDYLLSNILDPSAVMAKEYIPSLVITTDGRAITGIVRPAGADAVEITTANETLVLPRDEIDEIEQSTKSMMPDDILQPLSYHQIRSLIAYLSGPAQTPLWATAENVRDFFNGRDLTGWQGDANSWRVENGQLVGRTAGGEKTVMLVNDLLLSDFRLRFEVKLDGDKPRIDILLRGEIHPDDEVHGYRAHLNGRDAHGESTGETLVRIGEWNTYDVVVVGDRVRTFVNGRPGVDLVVGASLHARGVTALEMGSGGPAEVRFRGFKLELDSPPSPPTTGAVPSATRSP